jgi:hypothetical protein
MPIKQKMIPDEEAVPTGLFSIERECEQIVRIAVLAEILDVDSALYSPLLLTSRISVLALRFQLAL